MLYALLGIFAGIILGAIIPLNIPMEYSRYTAVVILVIFDALFAGIRSQINKEFHVGNFVFGMLFYMVLTVFLVYLGDKLNLDLYLGIIVVFVFRIMQNIGALRTFYFKKLFKEEDKKTDSFHIEY